MSEPTRTDLIRLVDPELLPALRALKPGIYPFDQPPFPTPVLSEHTIPGPIGAPDLRIYVVNARPGTSRPGIVHMHGGGYVGGTPLMFMRMLQSICAAIDCVIVTVDYRLAPATPFPGSLEDNYAALRWTHEHAGELGLDRTRIALMGESAGGGHAAALAIKARDRGEFPIILQMLIYAMLDDRTGVSIPIPAHLGTFAWTEERNTAGWTALLGKTPRGSAIPVGAVPARLDNLAGLPPAFVGVGSLDLLASEDIEYARRLNEAGVVTELFMAAGAYHGFDLISPEASVSKAFTASKYGALRRAFGIKA